jgi:hypothetical protein
MFRVALRLGMTVDELGRRMSADELMEWLAFDRIEPYPDPYWVGGEISLTVARCLSTRGSGLKREDFMPRRRAAPGRVQSPAEGMARMDAVIAHRRGDSP